MKIEIPTPPTSRRLQKQLEELSEGDSIVVEDDGITVTHVKKAEAPSTSQSLMVILVIDQHGIAIFKCEGQVPVPIDPNRPMFIQPAVQSVQPPSWKIHVRRLLSPI